MDLADLIKRRNKYLIIYLILAFIVTFIPVIFGAVILDSKPNDAFGIILVILGGLIFVSSTVWLCVACGKINKKINRMKCQSDAEKIKLKTGNRIFKTTNDEVIEFNDDFFMINDQLNYYNNYSCIASFRMVKDLLIPCIVMGTEDSEPYIIDLDGDLLDVLEESKLEVLNKEELDFYINNIEVALKQANKQYVFSPRPFMVMEFKKNKEDAKKFSKRTIIYIISSIILFLFVIGINVLLIWLGDSKEGIEFSNKIGMDLIIKIVFSIILIALIFVKSEGYSIYTKIAIGLYLIVYWLGRISFNERINLLIDYIFMIGFAICGLYESYRSWKKEGNFKKFYNRYYGITVFLGLMQMFVAFFDFAFVNDGMPWLIALYITLFILLVSIVFIIIYIKKHSEQTKKQKIISVILTIFWTFLIGYYVSIISVINLNYAIDNSLPIINSYEIIELENGDDNESDSAKVMIDGKEISISISDEEYHKLSVGDEIEVYYHKGAFGLAYYIHYSE